MKAVSHLFPTFFLAMVLISCQKEEIFPGVLTTVDHEYESDHSDMNNASISESHEEARILDKPDVLIKGQGMVKTLTSPYFKQEVGDFEALFNGVTPCQVDYSVRLFPAGVEGKLVIKTQEGTIFLNDIAKYGDKIFSRVEKGTGEFEGMRGRFERQVVPRAKDSPVNYHAIIYLSGWMTR